ncbi:MAG: hypothetical protein V4819_24005, partial [Verrucomicrobiota bacterium]
MKYPCYSMESIGGFLTGTHQTTLESSESLMGDPTMIRNSAQIPDIRTNEIRTRPLLWEKREQAVGLKAKKSYSGSEVLIPHISAPPAGNLTPVVEKTNYSMRHFSLISVAISAVLSLVSPVVVAAETEEVFLSGTGADNTVPWEFFCTGGRNSGVWTSIPVPSCWELQGFGAYNYG